MYDCGDECQEEDLNIAGIQNWFLERLHDPAVRVVVILSPGLQQCPSRMQTEHHHQLLVFILGQLMAVNVTQAQLGRIFVVL